MPLISSTNDKTVDFPTKGSRMRQKVHDGFCGCDINNFYSIEKENHWGYRRLTERSVRKSYYFQC